MRSSVQTLFAQSRRRLWETKKVIHGELVSVVSVGVATRLNSTETQQPPNARALLPLPSRICIVIYLAGRELLPHRIQIYIQLPSTCSTCHSVHPATDVICQLKLGSLWLKMRTGTLMRSQVVANSQTLGVWRVPGGSCMVWDEMRIKLFLAVLKYVSKTITTHSTLSWNIEATNSSWRRNLRWCYVRPFRFSKHT